jgi:hypothetical protein
MEVGENEYMREAVNAFEPWRELRVDLDLGIVVALAAPYLIIGDWCLHDADRPKLYLLDGHDSSKAACADSHLIAAGEVHIPRRCPGCE